MKRPKIVCLCGSTRFPWAFQDANFRETMAGRIVLTIGCDMKSDNELFADKSPEELAKIKARLDKLHLHKIDLADEVLILNVAGYIGESTQRELDYALVHGKKVRFLIGDTLGPGATKFKVRRGDVEALRKTGETVYRWFKDVPSELYTKTRAKKEGVALDSAVAAWVLSGDAQYRYALYRPAVLVNAR